VGFRDSGLIAQAIWGAQ